MKRRATIHYRVLAAVLISLTGALTGACSAGKSPPPPPACDQSCSDDIALRALRETMKLAFNVTFQGLPVGAHDVTKPCPLGGTGRVFGTATSNAVQGATMVDITFVFDHCGVPQQDTDPKQTYSMTLTGTATEKGTIAVQPSSTTSLDIGSASMTLSGTVYDSPPIAYTADACPLALGQNGNQVSGTLCGRPVGLTL